jgi:hypothetical protein
MKDTANGIETTIIAAVSMLKSFDQTAFEAKPSPATWSKKEIIGHLIDSAQNNIRRFVAGQYDHSPKIVYAQDDWVKLQNYQSYDRDELIQLWVLLNKHLCRILKAMPPAHYERTCDTGKGEIELHTLKYLAEDYLVHMRHHLRQINPQFQ